MIACVISCGPRLKLVPDIKAGIIDTHVMVAPVYKQPDTLVLKPVEAIILHDKPVITEIKQNAEYSPINDTLFKRNLELQRIAIRTLDRAHDVRVQKDSVIQLLRNIRDTVNATKFTTKVAIENKKIVTTTYKMFDFIILVCVVISALGVIASWLKPFWKKIHTA